MNNQQIQEIIDDLRVEMPERYNDLINFLTKYISIAGFPEEKGILCDDKCDSCGYGNKSIFCLEEQYKKHFNQALQDCKLHLLKKAEGIEEVLYEDIRYSELVSDDIASDIATIIAKAIQSKLLGDSDER